MAYVPGINGSSRMGRARIGHWLDQPRIQNAIITLIIINAMQSYNEAEQHDANEVVDAARKHIEADLHTEMRGLRDEIREMKTLLSRSSPRQA
jgi:hypothetical protein